MLTAEHACAAFWCRRVVIIVAVFCLVRGASAQVTDLLDSAKSLRSTAPEEAFTIALQAYGNAAHDSTRAKALLIIGSLHSDLGRYDSALVCLEKSLDLFTSLGDSSRIADVYEQCGNAWEYLSENTKALENYYAAYDIRKKLHSVRGQASSLNSIGNVQVTMYNYPKALENFFEVLRLGQELGDEQLITNAHHNIGMVHDYTNDFDKALEYYEKARQGFENLDNRGGLGGTLNNIGLIYKNKGEPAKAIPVYEQALEIFTALKSPYGVAVLQNNLGVVYQLLGDYYKSLSFHQAALKTNTEIGNQDGIANSNNSIGDCYLGMKRYREAIMHFSKGYDIASRIRSMARMAEAYEGLSTSWEGLRDYQKSLHFLKEARVLRDSILSAEKFQKLYEMEQKYESALKERQIALLNAETANQQLAIAEQQQLIAKRNTQLILVISVVALIIIVVYFVYWRMRLIQKARLETLTREKEQAVMKSIYEQRLNISKDMHDEIGSGLTHIAMLSEVIAVRSQAPNEIKKEIHTITDTARALIQNMSEIIWALNPHNESLSNLIAYLREQTNKYFEPFDVEYALQVADNIPEVRLNNIQRRNLFLVTKETLNNALKHARASAVKLVVRVEGTSLAFEVCDNGRGFDIDNIRRSANGLRNMRSRMEEINGTFEITSSASGTSVRYTLPLGAEQSELIAREANQNIEV